MAALPENLDARTPSLLFETGASDWNDLSAVQYLANLTRYLRNITISVSRPRLSDKISVDSDAGLVWLISIPVAFFVVVAIFLGVLLFCFWYLDKSGGMSPSISEASVSSGTLSSLKGDNPLSCIQHDTVVVNEALHSPHHSSVRSYLISTQFQDILRISDGSKGSTRSLGVLTEKDLHLPSKLSVSTKSPGLTPTGRRQPTNVQEYPSHLVGVSDRQFDSRTFTRVKSTFRTELRSGEDIRIADGSFSSRTISSFSTDSLEEKVSADSLRATMEFHKDLRAANGKIGPGDLYGCLRFVQDSPDMGFVPNPAERGFVKVTTDRGLVPDSSDRGFVHDTEREFVQNSHRRYVEDVKMNHETESKMDKKFIFLNHLVTDSRIRDTDTHLKETYEAALKADKMNFYYGNSKESSSSIFPSIHFPGYELSKHGKRELTPFRNAYTLNYENSDDFSETRQEYSVKNTGTNCQKMNLGSYITTRDNMKECKDNNVKARQFASDSDSHLSSAFFTEEDTRSSNDRQRSNRNDISLVSLVLSDELRSTPFRDSEEDFQAHDVGAPDFDISTVSQIALTSQEDFESSQESFGPGNVRPNEEVSFGSADNSLPSSIARFHASNLGEWPSPCAGYSLPSDTDLESSQNQCLCKDCPSKRASRSSLSVNFGSFTESTTNETRTTLSQDISSHLSQNGTDCDPGSSKLDSGLVKLSKRPSPLSSFVNNIRHRYSLDDNCLKSKREASEEEEALLLSPILQKEFRTKQNKQHFLDTNRRKVSVEERLQEYGFLKCKGKKYIVNPSPGKYETGAGYYNLVFANNEDCETPRQQQESVNQQSSASHFDFSTDGIMAARSLAQRVDEPGSDYQYSPFMEDSFYHFSLSRFNQRNEIGVRATCSSLGQESNADLERDVTTVRPICSDMIHERTAVFEAHCGDDDSNFSDVDFTLEESRNDQKTREINHSSSDYRNDQKTREINHSSSDHGNDQKSKKIIHSASPLPDHRGTNNSEKQHNVLTESQKNVHKAKLIFREYGSPGNKDIGCKGPQTVKPQNRICQQTEFKTHENNQIDSCGKGQNYDHRRSQNNACGNIQSCTYRKGQDFVQDTSEISENNNTDYDTNYQTGKNENSQKYQNENSHKYVIEDTKKAKKSRSSDSSETHSSSKKITAREDNCASSKSSLGKAFMEADHKLKRQQASRTLLSLENGFSRRCEIQIDHENGFSDRCEKQQEKEGRLSERYGGESELQRYSRLHRPAKENLQAVKSMDSVRV